MNQKLNIVVGFDFGGPGALAFERALHLAIGREGAQVHLVHAMTKSDLKSPGSSMEKQSEALEELPKEIWARVDRVLSERQLAHDAVPIWQHIRIGDPTEVILQVAADYDADLVVVGTRGRKGVERLLLGSVAKKLVDAGEIPVLVAHENHIGERAKTERPSEAPKPGELLRGDGLKRHVYTSSLIDAWKGISRSSIPFS